MNKQRKLINTLVSNIILITISSVSFGENNNTNTLEEIPAVYNEYLDLSLNQLMNVKLTSVAKKPQKKSETAASVYIITAEELKQRGVKRLPEALRYVPGVQVAKLDTNKWAITVRGFNSRFANKLLVMIDGRTIYTPLFAGVFWDMNHVPIENIERIEVIKGPGGTIWGSNAVNGIINIITKNSSSTTGKLLSGYTETTQNGALIQNSILLDKTNNTNIRLYVTALNSEKSFAKAPEDDLQKHVQTGFRIDSDLTANDNIRVQGDYYDSLARHRYLRPTGALPISVKQNYRTVGGNILANWQHTVSDSQNFQVQAFYDFNDNKEYEQRSTYDIDFMHNFTLNNINFISWGLGLRYVTDNSPSRYEFSLTPNNRKVNIYTAFIQDEVKIYEDFIKIILGSKVEHNPYTAWSYQPSARLLVQPDLNNTYWAAITRANRTPARGERDVNLKIISSLGDLPFLGNKNLKNEQVTSFELGHRKSVNKNLFFDMSIFYNIYKKLAILHTTATGVTISNKESAISYGAEILAEYKPIDKLSLTAAYSYLYVSAKQNKNIRPLTAIGTDQTAPRNQVSFISDYDIRKNLHFNLGLRGVESINIRGTHIHGYTELDANVIWQVMPELELSLRGTNLLDKQHEEYAPTLIQSQKTEVKRNIGVYFKLELP